jgi:hypothetical protein
MQNASSLDSWLVCCCWRVPCIFPTIVMEYFLLLHLSAPSSSVIMMCQPREILISFLRNVILSTGGSISIHIRQGCSRDSRIALVYIKWFAYYRPWCPDRLLDGCLFLAILRSSFTLFLTAEEVRPNTFDEGPGVIIFCRFWDNDVYFWTFSSQVAPHFQIRVKSQIIRKWWETRTAFHQKHIIITSLVIVSGLPILKLLDIFLVLLSLSPN